MPCGVSLMHELTASAKSCPTTGTRDITGCKQEANSAYNGTKIRGAGRRTCSGILLKPRHFDADATLQSASAACKSSHLGMAIAMHIGTCMVRIDDDSAGRVKSLRLSGRIQAEDLVSIRSAMNVPRAGKILDLADVNLVDITVVRFLIRCEDEGVELVRCPPYVREWMARERAQE